MTEEQLKKQQELKKLKELKEFKTKASAQGFHVRIPQEKFTYEPAREISNAFFKYKPEAVAFPRNATQIISCLQFCKEDKKEVRKKREVRLCSGGHQHEGMCSAEGIFMIRLSDINLIQYQDDDKMDQVYITPKQAANKEKAWIGVGCKLKAVYDELELYHRMIPSGGCSNVNVGGLTQGGGWGLNSRKYGLTCDNVLAVEIILANQEKVIATKDKNNKYNDLFEAICGGGGGNFGIVTRFLFKLHKVTNDLSKFSISWTDEKMESLIQKWLEMQATLTPELTTYLRIQVDQPTRPLLPPKKNYPIRIGGLFHGTEAKLREIMKPLLDQFKDYQQIKIPGDKNRKDFETIRPRLVRKNTDVSNSGALGDPSEYFDLSLADAFNYDTFDYPISSSSDNNNLSNTTSPISSSPENQSTCKVAPPSSNCETPHPHKVSSVFSNGTGLEYYAKIAEKVARYYKETSSGIKSEQVRSYMTFHTLGGKIKEEPEGKSGFAFRDREFLMQFQSWWNYPIITDDTKTCPTDFSWQEPYIDWVKNFRKYMLGEDLDNPLVDGAFINFVDKDLGFDYTKAQGKYDLLKVYYGDKLDRLIEIKKEYDPNNLFKFKMSIPTEKP